jgi:excinuclease ABC subunit B
LDLPEVSLVAILDADKEGFLRNERSLTQTAGRAARNVHGRVIMYADKVTDSMQRTIDETARRRMKQMRYNEEHHITPTQIAKPRKSALNTEVLRDYATEVTAKSAVAAGSVVASAKVDYESIPQLKAEMEAAKERMLQAAKELDFIEAAQQRDYMLSLTARIERLEKQQQ